MSVLEQARVFRIDRPENAWTVDQVVRIILDSAFPVLTTGSQIGALLLS
jgi:hypothetical protein